MRTTPRRCFRPGIAIEPIRAPSPHDALLAYKDALLAVARDSDVRSIIPFREEDIYVLSKYRSEFGEYVATLWPEFETLRHVHDRIELVEAAKEVGISVPQTQLLDDVTDWNRELIVKARYALLAGEYAEDLSPEKAIEMGKTKYLAPGHEPDRVSMRAEMGHDPIVQEYIPGTEYCFRALYDHGEPIVTSQKRLVRGQKYPRGPSVYHEAVAIPRLEERGTAILDNLDWHGVASVGFMRDERTGEFNLLEINPRFWASIPVDLHAGIDYPYYYW